MEDATGPIIFNGKHYRDEKYLTFTKLDAEGKPLWIRDARGNLVMQYLRPVPANPPVPVSNTEAPIDYAPAYDIAGNLLFQHSMDAGDRWMLNDATGKPLFAWNSRNHTFLTEYDSLHRPTASWVKGADLQDPTREILFDRLVYGDTPGNGLTEVKAKCLNLRGKPYQHFDTAGIVTNKAVNPATGLEEAFDFKGNLLRSTRRLMKPYTITPDWAPNVVAPEMEAETFASGTRFDALNRPIQLISPYSDRAGSNIPVAINVIRPGYNEANLLERIDVWLERAAEPTDLLDLQQVPPSGHGVQNIDYNAKGQRTRIDYANSASTLYDYDKKTFRLSRLLTIRGQKEGTDCEPLLNPRTCEDPPAKCSRLSTNKCILQDLSYTYDPVGNITHIHDAAQQIIFFKNAIVEPSNDYTYDALYRLIEASGREHLGQGGVPIPHSPEDALRVRLQHPGNGNALGTYIESYLYDAVGNILAMQHHKQSLPASSWKRCYQYAPDSNRLGSTSRPGEIEQPFYSIDPSEAYGDKYDYDVHGNMTRMPHLPLMQWDFHDQLQATSRQVVNNGPSETTWYVYDAAGQRVRKVIERQNGTRKEERIYLGGFEIYRKYDGNGSTVTLERETLHVMDDQQRIALVETRTQGNDGSPPQLIRYQLSNHLDSASVELNEKAQVISYEEYSPYGSTVYQAVDRNMKAAAKRYRYTGKERDEETGLYYYGARYYISWLGRWCNCDPVENMEGANLYEYASSAPIVFFDPSGMQPRHGSQNPSRPHRLAGGGELVMKYAKSVGTRYYQRTGPFGLAGPIYPIAKGISKINQLFFGWAATQNALGELGLAHQMKLEDDIDQIVDDWEQQRKTNEDIYERAIAKGTVTSQKYLTNRQKFIQGIAMEMHQAASKAREQLPRGIKQNAREGWVYTRAEKIFFENIKRGKSSTLKQFDVHPSQIVKTPGTGYTGSSGTKETSFDVGIEGKKGSEIGAGSSVVEYKSSPYDKPRVRIQSQGQFKAVSGGRTTTRFYRIYLKPRVIDEFTPKRAKSIVREGGYKSPLLRKNIRIR